ncbi:MAG: hypothetical protein CMJ49_00220 [Planctomycetaceae bacterium]|nr:hypothetical protein [Planctomycetaceae bacterium]
MSCAAAPSDADSLLHDASNLRRPLAVCLIAALALGAAPRALAAPPPTPDNVHAIVQYNPARPILINWDDVAGETTYDIQRSIGGAPFQSIITMPADVTQFNDFDLKDLTQTYAYRVLANNDDGASPASTAFQTRIDVTWPAADGGHDLMQGFADGSPASAWEFHEGIDIFGQTDFTTVAARNGRVVRVDTNANGGTVVVEVSLGGNITEYDAYLHVRDVQVATNDVIAEGTVLATKLNGFGPGGSPSSTDHLHFAISRIEFSGAINNHAPSFVAFEREWLNPFQRFTRDADRDPIEQLPALADTNLDGKQIVIVRNGKTSNPTPADIFNIPVSGNIDLVADMRDPMHATFPAASQPHKAGYWIDAAFDQGVAGRDVRSAATPYVLYQFDDDWFLARPDANDKFDGVYADDAANASPTFPAGFEKGFRIPITDGSGGDFNHTLFPFVNAVVLTNTRGGTGNVDKVDASQFWNTNAAALAIPPNFDTANFATIADASSNAGAAFRDGDYILHVVMEDLVNQVDETAGSIRLNNFQQLISLAPGGQAPAAPGPIAPLYAPNPNPLFLHDFNTESADTTIGILNNQLFGVDGLQFYPDLLMNAFLFDHQLTWTEDDDFTGALTSVRVLSDSLGDIPLTQLGIPDALGLTVGNRYDVIIDYDRDGRFSATLDGLIGFHVIPSPAAAPAGLVLLTLLSRTGRKRRSTAAPN